MSRGPISDLSGFDNELMLGNTRNRQSGEPLMYDALTCSARYQAARPPVRRVGCIKHTRGSVLAELDDWAGNPKSPNIYWMNGMAGTGKTTIAYSLCSTLEANGQLAANFFCSRASPICRHAAWIVPDIAYQLAALFPAFYNPFAQVLQNQPNVFGCPVVDQVEKLLKQPLLLVNGKIPKNQVIVIDAIDECTDRADARAILAALMTFAMESHIKLFISCRPDFYVLKGVIGDSRFQVLHLHEIEESLVQADMVTYLRAELRPVSMPVEDIKRLAKLSGRLFLYARVAVVYILSRYRRRSTTLDIVMSNNDAFLDIDGLYKSTLYYILNDPDSEIDRHTARWILFALHTVVCSGKPIAMETLASLLGTRPIGAVEAMLRPLESLVHIPRDKGPIQLLHSSFADFILSQERAKLFFCNPERHGELLARIAGRSVSTVDPISREMPMSEIITQLSKHGCQDITEQLDEDTSSRHPVSDGGFGDVYKARLRDGTEVAIKVARVYIDAIGEAKALKHTARELYTWTKCEHPNVMKLLGLISFRNKLGMVSLWMKHGQLPAYLSKNLGANRYHISVKVCEGLAYLHRNNIVHGDLKGANILVSDNGSPMLADFGNAVLTDSTLGFTGTTTNRGHSLRWSAPEIIQDSHKYSMQADVYALGMTILQTITGKVPYHEMSDIGVMVAISAKEELPLRPENEMPAGQPYGDSLWELLMKCWQRVPEDRPPAEEAARIMSVVESCYPV